MKILFADGMAESAIERLREGGDTCVVQPSLTAQDLPNHIEGYDVLVVRSTKVLASTIDAASNLGLVIRAGAGTNTIDCDRAAERGVYVCNVPGRNAIAVAELTIGLMLAVDRRIASATADLRAGRWNKKNYSRAKGVFGSTFGIIGVGSIGIEVAERACGLGLRVIVQRKSGRRQEIKRRLAELGVEHVANQAALLAESDIVSVHVPGGPATEGMINADFLAAMKPDAMLLNTSRGETIDQAALLAALDSTGLRVGLDVFPDEPSVGVTDYDSALASHPKVTATHHIGASTAQAQTAVAVGTVELIEAYREGSIIDCVNLEQAPTHTARLVIRHKDRVGVLASVLQELRKRNVNVANMRNRIFAGSKAAVATIEVAGVIDDDLLEAVRKLPHVISMSVLET